MSVKNKRVKRKGSLAGFSEDTLDELTEDALARIDALKGELKNEGMTIENSRGDMVVNPKMNILASEREAVRRFWSTKFLGKSDGKSENYFANRPSGKGEI